MKYLVVDTINSRYDACLMHESGIATCSTGNGGPWTFTQSKLIDSRDEAFEFACRLLKKNVEYFSEQLCPDTGWYLDWESYSFGIHLCKEFEEISFIKSEWIYEVDVLEIEE